MEEIRVTEPGQKVRLLRLALGISLQELARKAGIGAIHLCRIEKLQRRIGEDALTGLCRELQLDADQILNHDLVFRFEEET